ncbi:MAG: FAD-dependent thymidylate synthase [Patescibacteria group bacterium]|nr:FAD-dependent thymidylate synthase [Patescibacteria group bacterium]
MVRKREIYAMTGIPEEVVAVAFAKTSRSPESFREIAEGLTAENSSKFHERWVVGYGHGSVAEHAVLHIAIENVSRLAVECVENNRLASYTEKSSRYQVMDQDAYYTPGKIKKSSHAKIYKETCNFLFDTYLKVIPAVKAVIEENYPREKGEDEKSYDGRIRSKYIDVCRFLLPTSLLTNVGMTINARSLEYAITKMLSHQLDEVREIGEEVKKVALRVTPTLVKYAEENAYLVETPQHLKKAIGKLDLEVSSSKESVELVDYDKDGEDKFLATLLYHFSSVSFSTALKTVKRMPRGQKEKLIEEALGRLLPHDKPIRELEMPYLTFDCLMDWGAYYDLKRNRIMTQLTQDFTSTYGYAIPKTIELAGVVAEYKDALEKSTLAYQKISKEFPEEAKYILTKAHNKRLLMKMNLRELFYFTKLRGRSNGHFAYRRIAMKIYELAQAKYPLLLKYIQFKDYPGSKKLEQEFFEEVIAK